MILPYIRDVIMTRHYITLQNSAEGSDSCPLIHINRLNNTVFAIFKFVRIVLRICFSRLFKSDCLLTAQLLRCDLTRLQIKVCI